MKALGAGLMLAVAALGPQAAAQPSTDIEAAVGVVMAQLDAFRRDDFDAAYTFASSMIREMFDRARFEAMVRGGYPEIARSTAAVVADRQVAPNGNVYLRLEIRGTNGQAVEAVYEMVREDGRWKINAVVTRPAPGLVDRPVPGLVSAALARGARGMVRARPAHRRRERRRRSARARSRW